MLGDENDVPCCSLTLQLCENGLLSLSAPTTYAGPTTSGLMRPSRVGPRRVKEASVSSATKRFPRVPPTCSVFFAQPGAESVLGGGTPALPKFPVLKTTSMSG